MLSFKPASEQTEGRFKTTRYPEDDLGRDSSKTIIKEGRKKRV